MHLCCFIPVSQKQGLPSGILFILSLLDIHDKTMTQPGKLIYKSNITS